LTIRANSSHNSAAFIPAVSLPAGGRDHALLKATQAIVVHAPVDQTAFLAELRRTRCKGKNKIFSRKSIANFYCSFRSVFWIARLFGGTVTVSGFMSGCPRKNLKRI